MFHTRILSDELDARLDSEFYEPSRYSKEVTVLRSRIPHAPLGSFAESGTSITYGIVQPGTFVAPGTGIRMIRCVDISKLSVRTPDVLWVSHDIAAPYARSCVKHRDVLIGIAGTLGCIGVVPSGIEPGNLNQSVARVRVDIAAGEDPEWVAAFLASSYGQAILLRRSVGSVQQHLNLADLPSVPVVNPAPVVRKYIGDKVRQAEELRVFEAMLEQQITSLFHLTEWQGPRVGSQKIYRSAIADVTTERLDAPHYDPAHLHLGKILKGQNALPLSTVCAGIDERWHRHEREFFYLEIGEIDLAAGRISARRLPTNGAPSRAQRLVKPWDVLVATVRPNRKNVAVVGKVSQNLPIVASTGFSVLRFQSDEAAAFYHAWLRSDAATQQLIQWSAGGAYPAIEEDIPLRILVPPFSDDLVNGVGLKSKRKLVAGEFVGKLCDSAKLLVEALIAGQIVEDELREAQQALDRGDTCPDRAILTRLTEHGIDRPGEPPLFPDLDALYAAIEESQRTESGNGDTA